MRAIHKKWSVMTKVNTAIWICFCACFISSCARAAGDAGAPVPIPRFTTIPSGGTAPVTVFFDPASSYLPMSPTPGQTYLYQAHWEFGDDSDLYVPPAPTTDQSLVLAIQQHTYQPPPPPNPERPTPFTVKLTLTIFINPGNYTGANAFAEMPVRIANTNFPPVAAIQNTGSVTTGIAPFMLTVTPSFAQDQDGYIVWVALDWGDGTAQLIPNPPNLPTTPILHQYNIPGIYKVTMSVIDNGRLPLGVAIPTTPAPNDPLAALAYYIGFQQSLPLTTFGPQFLDPAVNPDAPIKLAAKFDPKLYQDFIFVQVMSSMNAFNGKFKLDLAKTNSDTLSLDMKSNLDIASVAGATISITLGSGVKALKLPDFQVNNRGQYKNRDTGLRFSFNRKTKQMRLQVSRALLSGALNIASATVANGNTDVLMTVTIGGNTLSTVVRFAYQSEAGGKALGKNGHSYPTGN